MKWRWLVLVLCSIVTCHAGEGSLPARTWFLEISHGLLMVSISPFWCSTSCSLPSWANYQHEALDFDMTSDANSCVAYGPHRFFLEIFLTTAMMRIKMRWLNVADNKLERYFALIGHWNISSLINHFFTYISSESFSSFTLGHSYRSSIV